MPKRVRFAELLEQHEREIYRFAFRMIGNVADAQDVLQDTFLRAFQAYHRLPATANHRAWLFRIALRQSLNHQRAARTRRTVSIEAAAELCAPAPGEGELNTSASELDASLSRLSDRQRAALLMREYEGLTYDQVADALGCSEDTARAHVYQGKKKLRRPQPKGRTTP